MGPERNGGTAVCPGSYDPITMGHLDIIGRAANVFDNVVVGVVDQPVRKQKTIFSAEERVAFRGRGIPACAGKTL
jgi:pantetheine-phosphate adenylyltransferase